VLFISSWALRSRRPCAGAEPDLSLGPVAMIAMVAMAARWARHEPQLPVDRIAMPVAGWIPATIPSNRSAMTSTMISSSRSTRPSGLV
jgi:hypothetical protein